MDIEKNSEWEKIALSFIAFSLAIKILFFNESLITVLKLSLSVYWVFIIPGIGITYLFQKMGFIERFALSLAIGAALVGVSSYYLGIIGIHIKYSAIIVPAFFNIISIAIMIRSKASQT